MHTLTSARGQVINNLPASQMLFKIFFPTKYYISVREHLLQRQKMRFRQICAVKMHKCGLNYAFMHKSSLTKLAVKFSFSFSHDFELFDKCQLNIGKDRDRSNSYLIFVTGATGIPVLIFFGRCKFLQI